jgi:hypothetical protein
MTTAERRQLAAWILLPAVAATNGAVRDLTYGRAIGRDLAHSASCVPLAAAILWWAMFLARRWPVSGQRAALRIGSGWLGLTLLFEFGLGAAQGVSLRAMLAEYNILRGRLWLFVPLITAAAPEIARRIATRQHGSRPATVSDEMDEAA